MPELSSECEVAGRTPLRVAEQPPPAHVRSRLSPDHPSPRVRDPLGAALLRLHAHRHVLDLMETTISARDTTAPESSVPPDADLDDSDSTATILPLQPVTPEAPLDSRNGGERRRFPRRQSECAVALIDRKQTLELTPQETDWLLQSSRQVGRLLDISQAGLCLLLDTELPIGSEVLLRISNQQLNRYVYNAATVVRSQPAGHGRVSIHCLVQREFTLDQLQDLGRPQISGHVLA